MTVAGASVELIPVAAITVVNPRWRNQRVFREIVASIAAVGLKRPITVTRRQAGADAAYDLVCGQGRLEAFQALGQTQIPAFVVDADAESSLIMGLVENVARRQHQTIDLLRDIETLKTRGYTDAEIAGKTGLSTDYVRDVLRLLRRSEHRLLKAVETGQLPLSVAVQIAESSSADVQRVLQEAYASKQLRGRKLIAVRRLLERRQRQGRKLHRRKRKGKPLLTVDRVLRTYRDEAEKKRLLVRKAAATGDRLVFVATALRTLLADPMFTELLRAEGLDTMPKNLAERVQAAGAGGT